MSQGNLRLVKKTMHSCATLHTKSRLPDAWVYTQNYEFHNCFQGLTSTKAHVADAK